MSRRPASRHGVRRDARWPRVLAGTAVVVLGASTGASASARDVVRVSGADRFATAVAFSQQAFPAGSDVVVVVDALAFPDALSAAPAAGAFGAPILPVLPGSLPSAVAQEVTRLHATTALVVGGTSAVGSPVTVALQAMGLTVARASGADRYATAAQVATAVVAPSGSTAPGGVLVASGTAFADGLAGGAYGAATGTPLLLTDPHALPSPTSAALAALHPTSITVLGGPAAVSDVVVDQLAGYTSGPVRRVYGSDRYATAAAVQRSLWTSAPAVLVASGTAFPDALAAGALGAPILLTRPDCLPAASASALAAWGTTSSVGVGGTTALGDTALAGAPCPS